MSVKSKLMVIVISCFVASGIYAAGEVTIERDLKGQIVKATMPDGTVYENPFVVNKNELGIEIAHKKGIAFWKFEDLPANIQEKFGYDEARAEAYKKKMKAKKDASAKKKSDKKAAEKELGKQIDLVQSKQKLKSMQIEIEKTEKRIDAVKGEMAKLDATKADRLDRITGLAGKSTAKRSNDYSNMTGNTSSNRAERTKTKVVKGLAKDYKETDKEYEKLKKELTQLETDLPNMKKRYERMRIKLEENGSDSSQESGDSASRLKELDQLLEKKLINQQEYDKKRAEILKNL